MRFQNPLFFNYTKPKKYNKVRFTHHFWRDIASGASYASYTSKTLTIGFGIIFLFGTQFAFPVFVKLINN
ncbi:hypothetical protein NP7_03720 [Moraxella osloensis]|uniref:Uncharacterized protein n=1 Tax=Faucicola osloensis TaxID=34062 RepID=A0A2D2LTU3_FAUOS|nr:hypothetical protein NP7_03720 [Moraxella osloensis]